MSGNPGEDGAGQLPEGWILTSIGTLFEFKYGKGLKAEVRTNSGSVNVFGSNGVVGTHQNAITGGSTIIVGRKGSVGEVHLCQTPCWPIDTTYYIDQFPSNMPPEFWALFLKSLRLGQQDKSSAIPGISRDDVYALPIPLAPLAEQRRIVAKLDAVLGKVDACRQRLDRIPAILKRFRQSVLAAACSGRLTADWREGKETDWPTVTLDQLGIVSGGITKNPKRAVFELQVPYLRVANVYQNRLELDDIHTIGIGEKEFNRVRLESGDLLFVEGNGSIDQIGRVALWDGSITPCIHQNHLIKFRASERIVPKFVLYLMMSPQGRDQLQERATSSAGLHTLSISKIGSLDIPLPPLPEQREIVRRVNALFALADNLEARYRKAKAHVDKLTQSVLAKAFRGELVPTEAELARAEGRDYETAAALLERIQAERAGQATATRKRAVRKTARKAVT